MEICASCSHVLALHADRTGHCRLNGCRCTAFAAAVPPAELVAPEPVTVGRDLTSDNFTWLVAFFAFVLGVVAGHFT